MTTALLGAIARLLPGRYDNRAQRAVDLARGLASPHAPLAAAVDRVDAAALGDDVYLVRGWADPAAAPYMTRLYAFHDGGARLAVHGFDGDARLAEGRCPPDLAGGDHRPGCDLAVRQRAGAVLCATDPVLCRVPLPEGGEAGEDYRLAFDGTRMHVLRVVLAAGGPPAKGRADRVPYRLLRLAEGVDFARRRRD